MSQAESEQEAPTFDKDNPFAAKITENRLLNKEGSSKDTRHFVVDISGSGLKYTCGDSIGIYPTNDSAYVENVLSTLNFTGDEMVVVPKVDRALPLRAALMHKLSLAGPSKKFLQALLAKCGENELVEARRYLEPGSRKELMAYLEQRELIDFFEEIPSARWEPQELVNLMKRLVPRLYSIASSPTLHPNDVHLTVAIVRYQTNGRDRNGVCTTYMTDRVKLDDPSVPIFIASSHFGLPEDMGKDVIMVGPGTGIAPSEHSFKNVTQEMTLDETGSSSETNMHPPTISTAKNWNLGKRMASFRICLWPSPVIKKKKYMFSTRCSTKVRSYGTGLKVERISMFAVMLNEWLGTLIPHFIRLRKNMAG